MVGGVPIPGSVSLKLLKTKHNVTGLCALPASMFRHRQEPVDFGFPGWLLLANAGLALAFPDLTKSWKWSQAFRSFSPGSGSYSLLASAMSGHFCLLDFGLGFCPSVRLGGLKLTPGFSRQSHLA